MSLRQSFRAAALALTATAVIAAAFASQPSNAAAQAAKPAAKPATPAAAKPAAPAAAKGDAAKGAAKYKVLCVACHKADGTGGFKTTGNPTPNWTLKKTWDATRTEAYLRDCIVNGKIKSGMVAWGKTGQMKPQEVEDMIAYILTFKAKAK